MCSDLNFLDFRYVGAGSSRSPGIRQTTEDVNDDKILSFSKLLRRKSVRKRTSPGGVSGLSEDFAPSEKKRKFSDGRLASRIMSGELQIVFIYDTLSVRKEEDDPKDAILYFHPDCIPEERRIAICGQLMGITHFLVDTFSAPKILTLDNGKFAMRKFGRQYVLALGCSSVTPDWLLEKQADILYSLTIFFHRDIKSILKTVNGDRLILQSRLSLIMDHYIPISQHHGDLFALTFGILPILNLPKSASNISLRATVVLQSCLTQSGVLGGIVMYQNKVIGVELVQELAQKLAFIQPYQLPPAEPVRLPLVSPPGVQIFAVYISEEELELLRKRCATFQHPSHCEPKAPKVKENNNKGKIDPIREEEDPSDASSSLGFSETSSSKDLSEQGNPDNPELDISLTESSSVDTGKGGSSSDKRSASTENPISISVDSNLKFEEFLKTNKGKQGLVVSHIVPSQNKTDDTPQENKAAMTKENMLVALPPPCVHLHGCGPNSLKPGRTFKSLENLNKAVDDNSADKSTPPPPLGRCFCASLTDPFFPFIRCDGKSISKALLDVYAGTNDSQEINDEDKENLEADMELPLHNGPEEKAIPQKINSEKPVLSLPNGSVSETRESTSVTKNNEKNVASTCNEVSSLQSPDNNSADTTPTSAAPRRPMDLPLNNKKYNRKKSKRRWSTFEDMMSPVVDTPSRVTESFPAVLPNINENWKNVALEATAITTNPSHQELYSTFKKLSSQDELQNCSDITSSEDNIVKVNGSISGNYQNPSMTGKIPSCPSDRTMTDFGSIPLQLKLKLSTATDGNKEGNKSQTHLYTENSTRHNNRSGTNEGRNGSCMITSNHVKSSLFIYSLGSMRLLLLLEKERTADPNLIQTLWEYGSSNLPELETAISNVEEQTMSTTASQHDHYCYLHYEAVWRSLAHGGRNHSMDFDVVQQMHQDFSVYPNISELIIRGEDHVVYGYQCVGSEVFYQQSAGLQPGLPMPSDLMGKVPFKAKRRLERDHNILLL